MTIIKSLHKQLSMNTDNRYNVVSVFIANNLFQGEISDHACAKSSCEKTKRITSVSIEKLKPTVDINFSLPGRAQTRETKTLSISVIADMNFIISLDFPYVILNNY